jgi:hypothetical protein
MPREEEMLPKDKYTLFDKKEKSYRKSIHSMPNPLLLDLPLLFVLRNYTDGYFFPCRAAQVDSCQPTREPPWFLSSIFAIPRTRKHSFYSPTKKSIGICIIRINPDLAVSFACPAWVVRKDRSFWHLRKSSWLFQEEARLTIFYFQRLEFVNSTTFRTMSCIGYIPG